MKKTQIFTNGLVKENPVLRLVLGTCPTLAVTTAVSNGVGMGIAATFVLFCSNIAISALRKAIPDKVRLPPISPSSPPLLPLFRCLSRPSCRSWTPLWACSCP